MQIQDLPLDIQYNILYHVSGLSPLGKMIRLCTMFCRTEEHSTWIQRTLKRCYCKDFEVIKMTMHLLIIASNMTVPNTVIIHLMESLSYTKYPKLFTETLTSKMITTLMDVGISYRIRSDILKHLLRREDVDTPIIVQRVLESYNIELIKYIPLKYLNDVDVIDYLYKPADKIATLKTILWYQLPSKSLKIEQRHYIQLAQHYSLNQTVVSRLSKHSSFDVEAFKKAHEMMKKCK